MMSAMAAVLMAVMAAVLMAVMAAVMMAVLLAFVQPDLFDQEESGFQGFHLKYSCRESLKIYLLRKNKWLIINFLVNRSLKKKEHLNFIYKHFVYFTYKWKLTLKIYRFSSNFLRANSAKLIFDPRFLH